MSTLARGTTLWNALTSSVRARAHSPALLSPQQGIYLTYTNLHRQALGLSKGLQERGVSKNDVVATDLPNVAEGLLLYLACSHFGAALATVKNADELRVIPNTKCALTASDSSWLAQHSLSAPPIIAGRPEMEAMLNRFNDPTLEFADIDDDNAVIAEPSSALGYFGSAKALTHAQALSQAQSVRDRLRMTESDRVCVSITLYHAFGIGSACTSALLSGAAIVLPAVGGLRGCGVPSQRAEATVDALVSEQCSLLFADTHTLKALNDEAMAEKLERANLRALRGGVCKTGSGSDILDGTVQLKGVELATLGKRSA